MLSSIFSQLAGNQQRCHRHRRVQCPGVRLSLCHGLTARVFTDKRDKDCYWLHPYGKHYIKIATQRLA